MTPAHRMRGPGQTSGEADAGEVLCSPCFGLVPSSGDASVVETSPVSFTSCWMVPSWLQGQIALIYAGCLTKSQVLIFSSSHKAIKQLSDQGLGNMLEGCPGRYASLGGV